MESCKTGFLRISFDVEDDHRGCQCIDQNVDMIDSCKKERRPRRRKEVGKSRTSGTFVSNLVSSYSRRLQHFDNQSLAFLRASPHQLDGIRDLALEVGWNRGQHSGRLHFDISAIRPPINFTPFPCRNGAFGKHSTNLLNGFCAGFMIQSEE